MVQTLQPEWKRGDRRKRNRRPHVQLKPIERVLYVRWYAYLLKALHNNLRGVKVRAYIYKPKNPDCLLPQDAVRDELRHVFMEDWKCSLAFNDIDNQIHMLDRR